MNLSEDFLVDSENIFKGQVKLLQTNQTSKTKRLNSYTLEESLQIKQQQNETIEQFQLDLDESDTQLIQSNLMIDQQKLSFSNDKEEEQYTETLTDEDLTDDIPEENFIIIKSQQNINSFNEQEAQKINHNQLKQNAIQINQKGDKNKYFQNQIFEEDQSQANSGIMDIKNRKNVLDDQNNEVSNNFNQRSQVQYLGVQNKSQNGYKNQSQKQLKQGKDIQWEILDMKLNEDIQSKFYKQAIESQQTQSASNSSQKLNKSSFSQKRLDAGSDIVSAYQFNKSSGILTPNSQSNSSSNIFSYRSQPLQLNPSNHKASSTMDRFMKFETHKKQKIQQLQQENQDREMKECSFKPKIHKIKNLIPQSNISSEQADYNQILNKILKSPQQSKGFLNKGVQQSLMCKGSQKLISNKVQTPFHQRLYQIKKASQTRYPSPNQIQENIQESFKPQINERSKSLTRLGKIDNILYQDALRRQQKSKRQDSPEPIKNKSISPNSMKMLKNRFKQQIAKLIEGKEWIDQSQMCSILQELHFIDNNNQIDKSNQSIQIGLQVNLVQQL